MPDASSERQQRLEKEGYEQLSQARENAGKEVKYVSQLAQERALGIKGYLYARCGGIFGVAGFVDRCMDNWMADPILNANDAVANWHEKAQRCGFKFLVTQLMGFLCGGPQVCAGRDTGASPRRRGRG